MIKKRKNIDIVSEKIFIYIVGNLLKIGLIIFLFFSFANGNVEPAFWFMGISLALAGILMSSNKKNNNLLNISRDFVYSTIFFIFAICSGGIQLLFNDQKILPHYVIIQEFPSNPLLSGLSWGVYGLTFIGIVLGSIYFINAVIELLRVNLSKDKRFV